MTQSMKALSEQVNLDEALDALATYSTFEEATPEALKQHHQRVKILYQLRALRPDQFSTRAEWMEALANLLSAGWTPYSEPHVCIEIKGQTYKTLGCRETTISRSIAFQVSGEANGTLRAYFPGDTAGMDEATQVKADEAFLEAFGSALTSHLNSLEELEQLRFTGQQYQDLFATMPIGIVYKTAPEGCITELNPAAEQILGFSRDTLVGKTSTDLEQYTIDAEGNPLPGSQHPTMIALHTHQAIYNTIMGLCARKAPYKVRWVMVDAIPRFRQGETYPYQVYATFRDITEFKQVQDSLRLHQHAIESSEDGIAFIDLKNRLTYANNAFLAMFGYAELDEVIGMTEQNLMAKEDLPQADRIKANLLEAGKSAISEFQAIRKDGSTFTARASGSIVRDQRGNPLSYLASLKDVTAEKAAEQRLALSEKRFQDMALSSGDLVWEMDRDGVFTFTAGNAAPSLGYKASELLGHRIYDFVPEKEADRLALIHQTAIAEEQILSGIETTRITKDGSFIHIQSSAVPIKDETGWVTGYRGVDKDITHNKEAEKQLQLLGYAIDQNPVPLIIANPDGQISFVNSAFEDVTGYSPEEIKQTNLFTLQTPRMNRHEVQELWQTLMAGKPWEGEVNNQRKHGEEYWEYVILSPIQDSEGFITHFIGVKQDITERKKARQRLQEEADFRKLLNQLSASFINTEGNSLSRVINASLATIGQFVGADRAYIFDYDFEHGSTSNTYEYCAEGTAPEIDNLQEVPISEVPLWAETHQKGEQIHIPDVNNLPDSNLKDILQMQDIKSLLTLPLMSNGRCLGFVGFDMVQQHHYFTTQETEVLEVYGDMIVNAYQRASIESGLVAAKREAERSNRLKTTFLANLSHEIRTPLNGILGFTDMLIEGEAQNREQDGYLHLIRKSGERLMGTIDDLVDISAIEAGSQTLNIAEVDLHKILEDLVKFYSTRATEKGLSLILRHPLPPVIQQIQSDRAKLESAITNLIKNAIRYTNEGYVHVGGYQQAENLIIYVSDTGRGISPGNQDLIFNRFEQVSFTDEEVNEGSGLGLAIAKAKVEMLGGHIKVDSAEGEGSDFYITIPARAEASQPASAEQTAAFDQDTAQSSGPGRALAVLIAEDDELSYLVLKRALENRAATVYRAENGKAAVQQVREHPQLDLVMMDIRMPEMNGLEATRQIRTFDADIPIFAQTAYAVEGDQQAAMEAGCSDYLAKPVNLEVLLSKLSEYFPA
jgi:PAS domain S-box-containing protein